MPPMVLGCCFHCWKVMMLSWECRLPAGEDA
jgi:hypothetical protein